MGRIGVSEILFIVLAVVVLFGSKKLPEIGSAIGKALREFKKASQGIEDEITDSKKNGSQN